MDSHPKILVVNVLLDNSVLTNEYLMAPKIIKLMEDLKDFNQAMNSTQALKLGVFAFEGLTVKTIKDYDSLSFDEMPQNGFPLMNRMLHTVTQSTESYIDQQIQGKGLEYFKPWLIILSSGMGLDKIDFFESYKPLNPGMQPVIFPFLLSKDLLMFDLAKINQIKPFIPLKDFAIDAFGEWLKSMVKQRLSIAPDDSMRLSKDMFSGWTQL